MLLTGCAPPVLKGTGDLKLRAILTAPEPRATAIVPLLTVDVTDRSIAIIPTDLPPRRIALLWHRDRYRSPAAQAFIEIAMGVGRTLAAELAPDPS